MITIYEACENSDLTEGKGYMRCFTRFTNEASAVEAIKGHGVQGVGDGEVYKTTVFETYQEYEDYKSSACVRVKVYGYRQDWRGKWGYGYVDNRDAPVNDPEYQEYMRLKNKFEGS